MSDVMTEEEFVAKVDSEGGFFEAIFGYGLSYRDVEPGPIRDLLSAYKGYLDATNGIAARYYELADGLEEEV